MHDQKIATTFIGRDSIIRATVADKPEYKKHQTYVQINNIQHNYSTNIVNCQAYAILAGEQSAINRSDIITIRGSPQSGFGNYTFSIYHPQLLGVDKPSPPDYALQIRDHFIRNIRQSLGDNDLANLALGFLMGEKSLSAHLKEQLKNVGLSHIVVASGFCLSILVNFAKKTVGKISRFAGYFFAFILIAFFISITGFSASLVRAGIVSALSLFAGYFGRRFHPGRLLVYATTISVLVRPAIILELA